MAERSTITQTVQVGLETTPGTSVAAGKRLQSIGIMIGAKVDSKEFTPIGQKYPTLAVVGKEWSESEVSGSPVYTELPYIFASLMDKVTPTEIMDTATPTGGYTWSFDSDSFGEDTPATYTVEQGSAVRAHKVTNGIISEFNLDWSREEVKIGGTMLATALNDGITMTATPTLLPQVPVRPSQLSVYLDTTAAGLGTTKLTRALKGSVKISDRFSPLWVVDASKASFVNTVETAPKFEFTLMQMADATAMGNLTSMRNGSPLFLRIEAEGPQIYSGGVVVKHKFTMDLCGQIKDIDPFEDADGVYAINWTFLTTTDSTWGKAWHVDVITTTDAL